MRAHIHIQTIVEFELNPDCYPGCSTQNEMLAYEILQVEADPVGWLQPLADLGTGVANVTYSVTGRLE